jgi:hypothetical protein
LINSTPFVVAQKIKNNKAGLKPYPIDKFHTICCGAKNKKQQGRVETLPN